MKVLMKIMITEIWTLVYSSELEDQFRMKLVITDCIIQIINWREILYLDQRVHWLNFNLSVIFGIATVSHL